MDCALRILVWATVLGLGLDIIGFGFVIRYGHSLFLRTGAGPPPPDLARNSFYFQYKGPDKDPGSRRRFLAKMGVATVAIGFAFQIVGAVAAIHLSN